MSGRTRELGTDLLAAADSLDVERRLAQASARAEYLARASRTVRGPMHSERAMDLVLELIVPELVDRAQLVARERGVLSCRSLLAGQTTRS